MIDDLHFTPRPHQCEARDRILAAREAGAPGFLLGDLTGLGKTLSVWLAILAMPEDEVRIICPKGAVPQWRRTMAHSGSHAKSQWNSETDSNFSRMVNKGMVKADDFKIVFRSELIADSPYIFITSLPTDARTAIKQVFIVAPQKAKAQFERLSDGKDRGFQPVSHKDYEQAVELQKFVDALRRRRP